MQQGNNALQLKITIRKIGNATDQMQAPQHCVEREKDNSTILQFVQVFF
jgi:hypothetical protein